MKYYLITALATLMVLFPAGLRAWDVTYEATSGLMPDDPGLGTSQWSTYGSYFDSAGCSLSDGALHLYDSSPSENVYFHRTIASGPITAEVNVRVVSATLLSSSPLASSVMIEEAVYGAIARVNLWTDHISMAYGDGTSVWSYAVDMTQFHVIRVALESSAESWIWLDGNLLYSGPALGGGQGDFTFGGNTNSDAYWQYVDYSNSFVPVPEPPSLVALLCGVAGLGGVVFRRRR